MHEKPNKMDARRARNILVLQPIRLALHVRLLYSNLPSLAHSLAVCWCRFGQSNWTTIKHRLPDVVREFLLFCMHWHGQGHGHTNLFTTSVQYYHSTCKHDIDNGAAFKHKKTVRGQMPIDSIPKQKPLAHEIHNVQGAQRTLYKKRS